MVLLIHVKPNSKTDLIYYDESGALKIKIRAQPIDGKANVYLVEYLSGILHIPKSKITILKGANNQFKKIEIIENDEKVHSFLGSLKTS